MTMTPEERKEWAHERLTTYLRDVEISEFLDEMADVSRLEDRVCDLESGVEDHDQRLDTLSHDVTELEDTTDRIDAELDKFEERVADIEGELESLAS